MSVAVSFLANTFFKTSHLVLKILMKSSQSSAFLKYWRLKRIYFRPVILFRCSHYILLLFSSIFSSSLHLILTFDVIPAGKRNVTFIFILPHSHISLRTRNRLSFFIAVHDTRILQTVIQSFFNFKRRRYMLTFQNSKQRPHHRLYITKNAKVRNSP